MATTDPTAPEDPEVIPSEVPDAPLDAVDTPSNDVAKQFIDSGFPIDGPSSLTQYPSSRI